MSQTFNHHRSRFGFHPCSYELFLKLRYVHRHYWITVRDFHRWYRWIRKEPQNRIGSEPAYCPVFVENRTWIKSVVTHGVDGYKILPKTLVDHGIVDLYHTARMPSPEPVPELSSDVIEQIENLYDKLNEWFASANVE